MHQIDSLREQLRADGVELYPFILIGHILCWDWPELGYGRVLQEYSDYVGDAPERVHAELCRRLLSAGKEIRPEDYFSQLRGRRTPED